jgi:serine/threonine-protein phosphatase 5
MDDSVGIKDDAVIAPVEEMAGVNVEEVKEEDEARAMELKEEGNNWIKEGHCADAARSYTLALSFSPKNTVLLCNRAMAYLKSESFGLAIADASAAVDIDKSCVKAYYRRGSAEFALMRAKAARKDFRMVCKLKPKDRDARSKLQACEKLVKEQMFAEAIQSEGTTPLSEQYDPASVKVEASYDGPRPFDSSGDADDEAEEKEADFFVPGHVSQDFVMVRSSI